MLRWATADKSRLFGHVTAFPPARDCLRAQPVRGVHANQPRLQGSLLCRADWLCFRGIAATECVILDGGALNKGTPLGNQPRLQGNLWCRTDWLCKIRMGDLTHPRNRTAKGLFCVRQNVRRRYTDLTLFMVDAPLPRARVSSFLSPMQPFFPKQHTSISISGLSGTEVASQVVNEQEDDSSPEAETDRGEKTAHFYLSFCCNRVSLAIAP